MSQARIHDVEAAILAALKEAAPTLEVPTANIQTVSSANVDFAREQVIINAPAILLIYLGGSYEPENDTWHLYNARYSFLLQLVVEGLRGGQATREGTPTEMGAYELIEGLKRIFAGRKLELPEGAAAYCRLMPDEYNGTDERGRFLYSLEIRCDGIWLGE